MTAATTEEWSAYKIELISPELGKPSAATISTPRRPTRASSTGWSLHDFDRGKINRDPVSDEPGHLPSCG